MKNINRRSLFGWLAAAPVVAPLLVKAAADAVAQDDLQILLDAGQKSVDPPFLHYPGGITWFDDAYREDFIAEFERKNSFLTDAFGQERDAA